MIQKQKNDFSPQPHLSNGLQIFLALNTIFAFIIVAISVNLLLGLSFNFVRFDEVTDAWSFFWYFLQIIIQIVTLFLVVVGSIRLLAIYAYWNGRQWGRWLLVGTFIMMGVAALFTGLWWVTIIDVVNVALLFRLSQQPQQASKSKCD